MAFAVEKQSVWLLTEASARFAEVIDASYVASEPDACDDCSN